MAKFTPKNRDQHLQRMLAAVVSRTALTDLVDGSVFKQILSAVARELDDIDFQMLNLLDLFNIDRATGEDLDERAKDFNESVLVRKAAVAAAGNLEFTRTTTNPGAPIPVPIGTLIEVPGEDPPIIAETTVAGSIPNGDTTTGDVAAIIQTPGSAGNVVSGQLTSFKSAKPTGVDSATNPADFTGGVDEETDDAFRERIRAFIRSLPRCTIEALEFVASEVSIASGKRVQFQKAVEDNVTLGLVTLYIEDGNGTTIETDDNVGSPELVTSGPDFPGGVAQGGETVLFLDNIPVDESETILAKRDATTLIRDDAGADGFTLNVASGQIVLNTALIAGEAVTAEYTWFIGLIAEVQKVIDGDAADRVNYPGWRAAGVLVIVLAPTLVTPTVDISIAVQSGFDLTTAQTDVKTTIIDYINNLGVGNDVVVAEIIERSMRISGVFDVTLTSPASNVLVLEDRIARVATSDVTVA